MFIPTRLRESVYDNSKTPKAWRRSRVTAASAYAWLFGDVLWPTWERTARGRTTSDHRRYVEAMQWAPPEVIEQQQVEALRALLAHAGRHVPYYREIFRRLGFDPRDVRKREDLTPLPVLTRDIVRERYRDLVDPNYAPTNIKKSTSGSTGIPLRFEYSVKSESWRQAIRARSYAWAGYQLGLPTFYYWAQASAPQGAKGMKTRLDRALKRETYVDSMHQDDVSRRRALELFRSSRPSVIVCFVQSCAQFARWIVDHGHRDWDDVPVLCGAEPVLSSDRAVIERAFGPVFETYGSRETMLMAAECEEHDGLHLMEENVLVEVARGGALAAPGESGDVLVTDLNNYGMPFIRYQNGDAATFGAQTVCRCGRGLRRLQGVDGRSADTLTDRRGNPVPGIVFHVLLADASKDIVRQFQAVQRRNGDVLLRVVRGRGWSADSFAEVTQRFGSYLGGLPVEVEFSDAIAPASNGKMKTVVVER